MYPMHRGGEQRLSTRPAQGAALRSADMDDAIVLGRPLSNEARQAAVLMRKAHAERGQDRAISAIPLYEEAVRLIRRNNDPVALAVALRHLGDAYREHGDLDYAQPCYDQSLTIYRALDDTPSLVLANILRPVALLHEARGADDAAEAVWREAQELFGEGGAQTAVEECGLHLMALATPRSSSAQ